MKNHYFLYYHNKILWNFISFNKFNINQKEEELKIIKNFEMVNFNFFINFLLLVFLNIYIKFKITLFI